MVSQVALKSELMKALVEEQQKHVVHKVCDTVSELAGDLLDKNAWPELLPKLHELISSNNPAAMEAALLILANLASCSTDHLRRHLGGLTPVLGSCLAHSSIDVQVSSWGMFQISSLHCVELLLGLIEPSSLFALVLSSYLSSCLYIMFMIVYFSICVCSLLCTQELVVRKDSSQMLTYEHCSGVLCSTTATKVFNSLLQLLSAVGYAV